jgi:glycine/D-amino acid oxidase-like deaminating enzyme
MDRCLVLQRDGDWSAADLRSPSFGKSGVSIADSRPGTKSQEPSPVCRYKSQPNLVHTLISSPEMEVRQSSNDALLAAEDYLDDAMENQPAAIALRTAKTIQNELQGLVSIDLERACVGLRPMPADGIPIIGYLPKVGGVYVCAMHPGITLAAAVGRLVSEEIIDDRASSALCPCRPDRFLQA